MDKFGDHITPRNCVYPAVHLASLHLLGCFLSLFNGTNGLAMNILWYSEVKKPSAADRRLFRHAVRLMRPQTKSQKLMTLYKKSGLLVTSYKAYFLTTDKSLCYIKWREWPTKYTTLSTYSCDYSEYENL